MCIAPPGLGMNLPVRVTIANQTSVFPTPTNATFTYDAPIINFVSPNPNDALGGQLMRISGKNFGGISADVAITIGNTTCDDATWENDGLVTCRPREDVVGNKNVTIWAARRVSELRSVLEYSIR